MQEQKSNTEKSVLYLYCICRDFWIALPFRYLLMQFLFFETIDCSCLFQRVHMEFFFKVVGTAGRPKGKTVFT